MKETDNKFGRSLKAKEKLADYFMSMSVTFFVAVMTIIATPVFRWLDKRVFEHDASINPWSIDKYFWEVVVWAMMLAFAVQLGMLFRARALALYDEVEKSGVCKEA